MLFYIRNIGMPDFCMPDFYMLKCAKYIIILAKHMTLPYWFLIQESFIIGKATQLSVSKKAAWRLSSITVKIIFCWSIMSILWKQQEILLMMEDAIEFVAWWYCIECADDLLWSTSFIAAYYQWASLVCHWVMIVVTSYIVCQKAPDLCHDFWKNQRGQRYFRLLKSHASNYQMGAH